MTLLMRAVSFSSGSPIWEDYSWSPIPKGRPIHASSAQGSPRNASGVNMKKSRSRRVPHNEDTDTLRPEYDWSRAVRGVTAARYAQGTNLVLLDPDVAKVFPDSRAVNEALRTLARLARVTRRPKPR